MIIEISSSGGFGGLAAAGMNKRIDVDEQSASVKAEICELFEARDLRQLAARSKKPDPADMMTYRIKVIDQKSATKTYTIREDQLPPDMLDLIDSF